MKRVALILSLIFIVTLSGCSGLSSSFAHVRSGAIDIPEDKKQRTMYLDQFRNESKLGNPGEFKQALKGSLKGYDLLAKEKSATYKLDATITDFEDSKTAGMNNKYSGLLTVNYVMYNPGNGEKIWSKEINTNHYSGKYRGEYKEVEARGDIDRDLGYPKEGIILWDSDPNIMEKATKGTIARKNIARFIEAYSDWLKTQ